MTGLAILFVSAALFALTVSSVAGFVVTIACIASFLFLLGMFNPNTGALALTSVHEKIGMASALMGFIQMGLSALAAAIVSSLSGVSSTTMTTMLFACMGVSVACVFGVRLLGETAPESATSDMIHTTI